MRMWERESSLRRARARFRLSIERFHWHVESLLDEDGLQVFIVEARSQRAYTRIIPNSLMGAFVLFESGTPET